MKPTFDEWFLAKNGQSFDRAVFTLSIRDAMLLLARALRDYATEMAQ